MHDENIENNTNFNSSPSGRLGGAGLAIKICGMKFPENIFVGRVVRCELKSGDNFYNIEVALSTHFSTLRYVYIVEDNFAKELADLESKEVGND